MGSPSRALIIEEHLDKTPIPFKLSSERGFMTITGRYRGVPVSIVSTGMGFPNTDFFVREVRECLSGDMLVVRLVNFFSPRLTLLMSSLLALVHAARLSTFLPDPWWSPMLALLSIGIGTTTSLTGTRHNNHISSRNRFVHDTNGRTLKSDISC